MIQGNADFHPIDYDDVRNRNHKTELNLKNVLAFLCMYSVDEENQRIVKEHCTEGNAKMDTETDKKFQKKKQPSSNANKQPTHITATA